MEHLERINGKKQRKSSDFITKSDDWMSCVTEKDICGVPLLFETGPDHSIVKNYGCS